MNSLLINNYIVLALPEIFLSLWILILIPLGVYSGGSSINRQSYFSIFSLTGLLGTLIILLSGS